MYQQNTNLVLGSNTNHPSQNKFMNSEWCHQCKQRSNNVIHCGQGCNKKFCSRCLLRHYGEQDRDINIENWQCPFCKKICCCAYCRRNKDKLISSASNSLNSSNILGYGGNKNLYRKGGMGLYPLQKSEGSLKRDRDEDYLANYGDDYEDDYEQSDPEEDDGMMKRGQLNYGMNNRGGGINNMNNMGHLYKQNNNNNLLVDPRGYNNNPNYNNNNTGYYNNNGPPINNNINNNSSNNNNDNTNPNHISVPIAFRVVPLQTPTTTNNNNNSNSGNNNSNSNPSSDLLKLASTNDEYEWNPNKEEWMGTLFSHDLHDYGSLHVSDYPTGGGVKSNNRQDMYHSRAEGTQTGYSKSSRGNSGDSNDVYSQGGVGGYNNYGGRNDMMFKSNQERKGGRSLKKSVDYDSDYEYPDEQEMLQQQQKEQKYYMDPQQQQHQQQPQQHIQQQQQQHQPQQLHKPKPAHLVNNNNNSNNNNHHPYGHPGYIYHHNADNFLPDHDFQQRQMDVKRSRLPAHAVSVLKDWFFKHSHSPYPTEEEKEKFTKELSLTILQVNNWFTNARRRLLPDRI